jgi:hypothetical protein
MVFINGRGIQRTIRDEEDVVRYGELIHGLQRLLDAFRPVDSRQ